MTSLPSRSGISGDSKTYFAPSYGKRGANKRPGLQYLVMPLISPEKSRQAHARLQTCFYVKISHSLSSRVDGEPSATALSRSMRSYKDGVRGIILRNTTYFTREVKTGLSHPFLPLVGGNWCIHRHREIFGIMEELIDSSLKIGQMLTA